MSFASCGVGFACEMVRFLEQSRRGQRSLGRPKGHPDSEVAMQHLNVWTCDRYHFKAQSAATLLTQLHSPIIIAALPNRHCLLWQYFTFEQIQIESKFRNSSCRNMINVNIWSILRNYSNVMRPNRLFDQGIIDNWVNFQTNSGDDLVCLSGRWLCGDAIAGSVIESSFWWAHNGLQMGGDSLSDIFLNRRHHNGAIISVNLIYKVNSSDFHQIMKTKQKNQIRHQICRRRGKLIFVNCSSLLIRIAVICKDGKIAKWQYKSGSDDNDNRWKSKRKENKRKKNWNLYFGNRQLRFKHTIPPFKVNNAIVVVVAERNNRRTTFECRQSENMVRSGAMENSKRKLTKNEIEKWRENKNQATKKKITRFRAFAGMFRQNRSNFMDEHIFSTTKTKMARWCARRFTKWPTASMAVVAFSGIRAERWAHFECWSCFTVHRRSIVQQSRKGQFGWAQRRWMALVWDLPLIISNSFSILFFFQFDCFGRVREWWWSREEGNLIMKAILPGVPVKLQSNHTNWDDASAQKW